MFCCLFLYRGKVSQEQPYGVLGNHSPFIGLLTKEDAAKSFQGNKAECILSVYHDPVPIEDVENGAVIITNQNIITFVQVNNKSTNNLGISAPFPFIKYY